MRRETMFGLLALAIVMVSALSLPQGYAKGAQNKHVLINPAPAMRVIRSVSNPSAGCANLELTGAFGEVIVPKGRVMIILQNAHPGSSYTVSVDVYVKGTCDGSWQSVGAISTNQAGYGQLMQNLKLQSGHNYVFEFKDAQGNLVYATPYLSL